MNLSALKCIEMNLKIISNFEIIVQLFAGELESLGYTV